MKNNVKRNIFPKLRGKMAESDDSIEDLAIILNLNKETIRRKLIRGQTQFVLDELFILSEKYNIAIDELFIRDVSN